MYWLGRHLDPVTLTYMLHFRDFDTFCVDVRYLINYKAYNHQTLQSASSQCSDSADTLTWWPWPVFWLQWLWHNLCQPSRSPQVLRPLTTKPCIVLLLDVLTQRMSWPGDLDLHFALQCPLHILHCRKTIRPTTTKPSIELLLNIQTLQVAWLGDLDLYFALHWLLHLLLRPSICPQL